LRQKQNLQEQALQSKIVNELRTNIQDVTKKLRDVKGEKVPNQYIVVLKENNLLSPEKVKSLAGEATSQGAALRHIYDRALGGFAIKVPNEKALEAIENSRSGLCRTRH
jgi:hypothetical protein